MRATKRNNKITDIRFLPMTPTDKGLICFISFTYNEEWRITDCALYTKPLGGYRLSYPIKKLNNGKTIQPIYPISKRLGFFVEKEVIESYENFLKENVK